MGVSALVGTLLCAGEADAQLAPGDHVVTVVGAALNAGAIYVITAGGDLSMAPPYLVAPANQFFWGICRRPNGTVLASSIDVNALTGGVVFEISTGAAVPFATGLATPFGLHCDANGTVYVGDFSSGGVYDITAGGDFSMATPFASSMPANDITRRSDGVLLAVENQQGGFAPPGLHNITAGGDFAAATPFVDTTGGTNNLFIATLGTAMYMQSGDSLLNATAGGPLASLPVHATVTNLFGLYSADGALWAGTNDGNVYNATAGGTFAPGQEFASGLPGIVFKGLIMPGCGNGTIDPGEDCDDMGESMTCDADCTFVMCGDGTTNMTAGETCDDMGESMTCDSDCTAVMCGDGVTNMTAGEDCDDMGESMTCNADCTIAACGDGIVNMSAGEDCDDMGESMTCDVDCTDVMCGDNVTNSTAGEDCDDGGESATCDDDCTPAACGDGNPNMTAGETCDDGNTTPGDGCDDMCQTEGGMGGMGGAGGMGTGGMATGGGMGTGGAGTGGTATGGGGSQRTGQRRRGRQLVERWKQRGRRRRWLRLRAGRRSASRRRRQRGLTLVARCTRSGRLAATPFRQSLSGHGQLATRPASTAAW